MKTFGNIYKDVVSFENLILAWKRARKGKTKKLYVIQFEEEVFSNLMALHYELKFRTYQPRKLTTFVVRDPKTRKISKSEFRDRVVHHAIVNILEPIFERVFICDSCANRKSKGTLYALQRFSQFARKVSRNGKRKGWLHSNQIEGYCLKADIRHYFQEVDQEILLEILANKIADEHVMGLIEQINANFGVKREREVLTRAQRAGCLWAI